MSTQGREADALWYERRAKWFRARGKEYSAQKYEKFAEETRAVLNGVPILRKEPEPSREGT